MFSLAGKVALVSGASRGFPLLGQKLLRRRDGPWARVLAMQLKKFLIRVVARQHKACITQPLFKRCAKAPHSQFALGLRHIIRRKNFKVVSHVAVLSKHTYFLLEPDACKN